MDVSTLTGKVQGNWSQDKVENPKGKLDKDSFLKLFLTELKYQDPTEPMDNEKILTQTSQLTQLEAQEEQKKAMKRIVENFDKSSRFQSQYALVPAIGKLAQTDIDGVEYVGENKTQDFELYFDKPIKSGNIIIKDAKNQLITTLNLAEYKDEFGKSYVDRSGTLKFVWDGKNDKGESVEKGKYTITASYVDNVKDMNKTHEIAMGTYPISSVKFEDGQTLVKIGTNYISADRIKEIR